MNTKRFATRAGALAFGALLTTGFAIAQGGIAVIVDGNPVTFNGVGPQEVNGRVLVPLRGVLEKLGAYVDWDPAGQLVTAQRGDTSINLRIGSSEARVNNQPVNLDVPPEIYHGSTLVPLRFMSEALGADVRWEPEQYAVVITTGASTSGIRTQEINNLPENFAIQSFDTNRHGQLSAGDTVRFTMHGTPGGVATLVIPGFQRRIPMEEVASGEYVADWVVPDDQNGVNLSMLAPVAHLRFGQSEKTYDMAVASPPIDNTAPSVRALTPENQSSVTVSRPTISARFDDSTGSGLDPRSVRLLLDGVDVTSNATIDNRSIRYVPAVGIGPGRHDVTLVARDLAGNRVTKRWSFRVNPQSDQIIQSFTADSFDNVRPGDVLQFVLRAEPNGRATFSLGDIVMNKLMNEESPGKYVGTYTVRRGDDLTNVSATARFVARDGQVYNVDSRDRVDTGLSLDPPAILLPRADEPLTAPFVVEGRAPAGSRVHVHVDYTTNVPNMPALTGQVADVVVIADANGRFRTNPINIDTTIAGQGTTYSVMATTLGTNNQHSETTKITVTR